MVNLVGRIGLADGEDAVLLFRGFVEVEAGDEVLRAEVEVAVAVARPIDFAQLRVLLVLDRLIRYTKALPAVLMFPNRSRT